MSPILRPLFLALAVYIVVPLGDVPGLGVSLSAPLFAWAAVEAMAQTRMGLRGPWMFWAALVWLGCLLSLAVNLMSGRLISIESDEAVLLVRFAFWLAVFLVTAATVAHFRRPGQIAVALGVGAAALSLLRLAEGVLTGVWGGGNPRWLSQNDYGFGFSAFLPFLLWLAVTAKGLARGAAIAAAGAAWIAVGGNGSRSSWVAALCAALVLASTLALAGRLRVGLLSSVAACVLVLATVVSVVPSIASSPLERLDSLQTLEQDKSFRTRILLIEKGWAIFEQSPVFGVGLGRFTKVRHDADLRDAGWLDEDDLNRRTPHNAYIKALAETGVVGALPLACLFILLALRGAPAAIRLTRRGETWAAAVLAGAAGMSLHLWTMSGLTGTGTWFLLGLVAALIERDREEPLCE